MEIDELTVAAYVNHPLTLDLIALSCLRVHEQKNVFSIENLSTKECLDRFRFKYEELQQLKTLLKIPDTLRCGQHTKTCSGIDGLCILLRRLVYPNRLSDLEREFVLSSQNLSQIINYVLKFIWRDFSNKLTEFDHPWFHPQQLQLYVDAIGAKGAPLNRCFGFLDGTARPICRPKHTQEARQVYSGHKKFYALKYQTMVTPNGLIANIFGPIPGRRHDTFMLQESDLLQQLEDFTPFYLYADQGYLLSNKIIVPFRGGRNLTAQQRQFNLSMSRLRIAVEWPYGNVGKLFAFVDYKGNKKLFLQPVALYNLVASLFKNCHTCLNGPTVSSYFGVNPPSLEEYLA